MACCETSPMLKLQFERPVYTQDSSNEQIPTWSPYWTFYGTAKALPSREVVQAEQVQGETPWLLTVPYGTKAMGITSGMRCRFTYGRSVTAYCDGGGTPFGFKEVRIKAMEQTD